MRISYTQGHLAVTVRIEGTSTFVPPLEVLDENAPLDCSTPPSNAGFLDLLKKIISFAKEYSASVNEITGIEGKYTDVYFAFPYHHSMNAFISEFKKTRY